MKRFLLTTGWGTALLVCSCIVIHADPDGCQNASGQYRSAKSKVFNAIKTYAGCIRNSDGHDDCSSEFSNLHAEQDDFESAVSDYASDCE
jgi:hypothetical protein